MSIKLKRGTSLNLKSINPILDIGQLCFETDTRRAKIGDGSRTWNELKYINAPVVDINRDPLSTDLNFDIGQIWINNTSKRIFILNSTNNNTASWMQMIERSDLNWNNIQGKPNTLSGYGIYDAVKSSDLNWANIKSKPTTVEGFGITNALKASDINWNNIQGKPNTVSGYGITDSLRKTGDSMIGPLILASNPVEPLQAATKGYVDSVVKGINVGGIKSVQRGIAKSETLHSIPVLLEREIKINPINPNKSFLNLLNPNVNTGRIYLYDYTTIRQSYSGYNGNTSSFTELSWEVIEFF